MNTEPTNFWVQKSLGLVTEVLSREVHPASMPYSTDASILAQHMPIPLIILGPGKPKLAHKTDEYLELAALEESTKTYADAVFAGVFQLAMGILFLYASMQRIGAARTAIMSGTQVIFAPLISIIFFGETISVPLIVGTLIIFGGLAFVSASSPTTVRNRVPPRTLRFGYLCGVLTGFFWGASYPFSRMATLSLGYPGTSSLFCYIFGVAAISAVLMFSKSEGKFEIGRTSKVYLSLSGALNTLGTLARSTALSLAPVVLVSPFASLSPLPAVLLSYLIIQKAELINRKVVVGAVAVVTGAVIVAVLA